MTLKNITCHHGSPGSSQDFFHLASAMPQHQFILPDRVIQSFSLESKQSLIQLGYSFGCVQALIDGNENPHTQKIILIAPYLIPKKHPSFFMKSLLGFNFFKENILPKLAGTKLDQMFTDSAFPKLAPAHYIEDGKAYFKPERLAYSILEKD